VSVGGRLKHAWNSFVSPDQTSTQPVYIPGPATVARPDRPRSRMFTERTIISSIYTRLAIDVAGIRIEHVRTDDTDQYKETIDSGLNDCLNVEANIDQGARHFRQDIPLTLFTEGVAAIIPVDTTLDPRSSGNWDVKTMRVGTVLQWRPQEVQVRAYDERTASIKIFGCRSRLSRLWRTRSTQ
jgi:hypothetical protein